MKKNFIFGIMALAALASCSKSEVLHQESLNEKAISFVTYVAKPTQTKTTTIVKDNVKDAGIGILAWRTGDATVDDETLATNAPSFMSNIKLTWKEVVTSADGVTPVTTTWVGEYSPERYWPSTGSNISFYAYAPYSNTATNPSADDDDNVFHPENITVTTENGANVLTLTVPSADFSKHTDFMVARKGNGTNQTFSTENPEIYDWDGTVTETNSDGTTVTKNVGVNQNLNKNYTGAVKLQMKHALSKISFVAKSEDHKGPQNTPYSDGTVKVVLENIELLGNFSSQGKYDLYNHAWSNLTVQDKYVLTNDNTNTDPFNPIADEWYNHQLAEGQTATADNAPDANGWYRLNKSTHDLMVIPFANGTTSVEPATITCVKGMYSVRTYQNGNAGLEEIGDDRDNVYFGQNQEGTEDILLANPITLEPGKHYIFQFNIKLNKIEFNVVVEDWDAASYSGIVPPAANNNTGGTDDNDDDNTNPVGGESDLE